MYVNNLIQESVSFLAEKSVLKVKAPQPTLEQLQSELSELRGRVDFRPQQSFIAGSGEVRILRMDDIDTTDINNGSMIIWDTQIKKFRFVQIPESFVTADNVVRPTRLITGDYIVQLNDYYIGVNSPNPVTITLPTSVLAGKQYVIKDESGDLSSSPITIVGLIDNNQDVVFQINNGSLTLIYRNGWRAI